MCVCVCVCDIKVENEEAKKVFEMFTDFSSSTVEAIAASYHTLSRILLM